MVLLPLMELLRLVGRLRHVGLMSVIGRCGERRSWGRVLYVTVTVEIKAGRVRGEGELHVVELIIVSDDWLRLGVSISLRRIDLSIVAAYYENSSVSSRAREAHLD